VDYSSATGQVVAFSENPVHYNHFVNVNTSKLMGVLNHPYSAENFRISLPFNFQEKQSVRIQKLFWRNSFLQR
jgi:hypothetical protein